LFCSSIRHTEILSVLGQQDYFYNMTNLAGREDLFSGSFHAVREYSLNLYRLIAFIGHQCPLRYPHYLGCSYRTHFHSGLPFILGVTCQKGIVALLRPSVPSLARSQSTLDLLAYLIETINTILMLPVERKRPCIRNVRYCRQHCDLFWFWVKRTLSKYRLCSFPPPIFFLRVLQ